MAQQEEGWPLGLHPLNVRVGLARNGDFSGSISFNTLITGSPSSSSDSSSDLDTESTGSFFHDKSITLGSLIGVSNILELSRRSVRGRKTEISEGKNNSKSKPWIFSLCSRASTDATENVNNNHPSSLAHFLAVERRAAANNEYRRNQLSPTIYGPDEFALAQPFAETNSLFVNGQVAPPPPPIQSSPWYGSEDVDQRSGNRGMDEHSNGYGVQVLFSCMCGQPSQ